MGKRSDFERVPKDLYRTIEERAVTPVLPFLAAERITSYAEPCYGYGDLEGWLDAGGLSCAARSDIRLYRGRRCPDVRRRDGLRLTREGLGGADAIITNPPWTRALLHGLIGHWLRLGVVSWLLFDAGWKHTRQAAGLMAYCTDFVPIPRVKWIPGTDDSAKDDAGWYRFHIGADARHGTRFWPLGAVPVSHAAGV